MASNRPRQHRVLVGTPEPRTSSPSPYYRRSVQRVQPRSIDGIGERASRYVPANQGEYLESLSGTPPKLSRFSGLPVQLKRSDNIFDIKFRRFPGPTFPRLNKLKMYLPVICLAVVLFVSVILLSSAHSSKQAEADRSHSRVSVEAMLDTSNEISERRPTNIQSYQVASNLPRIMHIDDMGLSARVRRVGVGTETEIRLPSNIYDVGWYESSVKPGEVGAVVLTGHMSGPSKPGIFHDITSLKPGDELRLEAGDGKIFTYYVAKLQAFRDVDPLEPMLATAVPGLPGLNLITEAGSYDATSNTYNQRLVVYAIQRDSSMPADN